jgi:hypothetical protein
MKKMMLIPSSSLCTNEIKRATFSSCASARFTKRRGTKREGTEDKDER